MPFRVLPFIDKTGGSSTETDPIFSASEAAKFEEGDKAKLDGIPSGQTITDSWIDDVVGTVHTQAFSSGVMTSWTKVNLSWLWQDGAEIDWQDTKFIRLQETI